MAVTYRWHLKSLLLVLFLAGLAGAASADAGGPDFYQVKSRPGQAALRTGPSDDAPVLAMLYPSYGALKNLGCTGAPSFAAWQAMSPAEQRGSARSIWCRVEIAGRQGWVRNDALSEYTPPKLTPFNCAKAGHEIELLACSDAELSALDRRMDLTYARALAVAGSLGGNPQKAVRLLKAVQSGWWRGRNDCWKDTGDKKACAIAVTELRLAQLEAAWNLVPPSRTERYVCGGAEDFLVRHYPTKPLASVVVEHGDTREIMVRTSAGKAGDYMGEFGKSLTISGDSSTLVADQFKPPVVCRLDPSATVPGL